MEAELMDDFETIVLMDPIEGLPPYVRKPVIGKPPPPPKILTLTELTERGPDIRVTNALREASRRLTEQGVRHATLGALGIGIYGWPRATHDVDLLVGPEAWHTALSGAKTEVVDMIEQFGGIGIDYLPVDIAGDFLLESFDRAYMTEGVPIAPVEVVIMTKLLRLALRDAADIVEVLKAGVVDVDAITAYLELHTPVLTRRFRLLIDRAARERARGD